MKTNTFFIVTLLTLSTIAYGQPAFIISEINTEHPLKLERVGGKSTEIEPGLHKFEIELPLSATEKNRFNHYEFAPIVITDKINNDKLLLVGKAIAFGPRKTEHIILMGLLPITTVNPDTLQIAKTELDKLIKEQKTNFVSTFRCVPASKKDVYQLKLDLISKKQLNVVGPCSTKVKKIAPADH